MRALEIITGHVIYKPAYTYKFQLKTTQEKELLRKRRKIPGTQSLQKILFALSFSVYG